ncbi:Vacuolar protein-sorting-associated protein 36, partial [Physocladia obscura]
MSEPQGWTALALDSARRPILEADEVLLLRQGGVGLYAGATRLAEFDSGVVWATDRRLLWLSDGPNSENNQKNESGFVSVNRSASALALPLSSVVSVTAAGGRTLFKASPKIVLAVAVTAPTQIQSQTTQSRQSQLQQETTTWICSVCDGINSLSTSNICSECGVARIASIPVASTNARKLAAKPASEKGCPVCTFINHNDVHFCELCEYPFDTASAASSATRASTSQISLAVPPGQLNSASNNTPADTHIIKLSFRAGGTSDFLRVLQTQIDAKEWEKKDVAKVSALQQLQANQSTVGPTLSSAAGGITGIIKKVDESNQILDNTISTSFQDLDSLMSKASEMVKLAESITTRLNSAATAKGGSFGDVMSIENPELVAFRSFLVDLGIPSPVTKEMTGDAYTQEVCKELSEFLAKVLKHRYNGIIALTDLYCIFNRARGVMSLISPQDLQKSAALFETLGLPFRMRKFDSGLQVVHSSDYSDDAVATRILTHLRRLTFDAESKSGRTGEVSDVVGITSMDIAAWEGVSIILAKELLL